MPRGKRSQGGLRVAVGTETGQAGRSLPRSFFARPTLDVAADLLGKLLVHESAEGTAAGLIVEVEAYIGEDDPACHAAAGLTRRTAPLYEAPGHAYVYLNYGIHSLVNAVTEPAGSPAAVLIRALAPVEGLALMAARRGRGANVHTAELCQGPGNLSRALGISLVENRMDLTSSRLRIEDSGFRPQAVSWGPRIGIRVGIERPWRAWVVGHPAVSGGRRRAHPLHPGIDAGFSHPAGP